MLQVVVGVVLTALLGGFLVPFIKDVVDRRTEQFTSSIALLDSLASSLWTYWKMALRVAYYGRQGERGSEEFKLALRRWDADESWQIGNEIQIQVSRSKRLLPMSAYRQLDNAQRLVVDYLDMEIDRLRQVGTMKEWDELYASLMNQKRGEIDGLLSAVANELRL